MLILLKRQAKLLVEIYTKCCKNKNSAKKYRKIKKCHPFFIAGQGAISGKAELSKAFEKTSCHILKSMLLLYERIFIGRPILECEQLKKSK